MEKLNSNQAFTLKYIITRLLEDINKVKGTKGKQSIYYLTSPLVITNRELKALEELQNSLR